MKYNKMYLGDLIKSVDCRNSAGKITNLVGVNIEKKFIPSVANTIGTDLKRYKVIKKYQFACNPMHVGRDERLPVSLYMNDKESIISPAYMLFEVKNLKLVDPRYLMLLFKCLEFDHTCWFYTDGSVRGGITLSDLNKIELEIPDINIQLKIIKIYDLVNEFLSVKNDINDNLEKLIKTQVEKEVFNNVANIEFKEYGLLDLCTAINGYSYTSSELVDNNRTALITIKNFNRGGGFKLDGFKEIVPFKKVNKDKFVDLFDLIIACTDLTQNAEIVGNGEIVLSKSKYEKLILSMDLVKLVPNSKTSKFLLAAIISSDNFKEHCLRYINGSTVLHMNKKALNDYKTILPEDLTLRSKLSNMFEAEFKLMSKNFAEIEELTNLRDALLPKLMSGELDVSNLDI